MNDILYEILRKNYILLKTKKIFNTKRSGENIKYGKNGIIYEKI